MKTVLSMLPAPSPRIESVLPRKAQWIIFCTALMLRAGVVIGQSVWHVFFGGFIGQGDQRIYATLAENILHGRGMTISGSLEWGTATGFPFAEGPTAWVMPGYPLFLAACRALFGNSVLMVELVQCVLGAATAVLIARTTAYVFGTRAGVIGGLIAACYFELAMNMFALTTEPLYTFIVAGAILQLVTAVKTDTIKDYVAAGVLFGAAALVRALALPIALALACVMAARAMRPVRVEGLLRAAVFAGACVAVLLPWGLRNQMAMGRFMLLATEGGYVLWLGNNPEYDRMASEREIFGGYGPVASFGPVLGRLPETAGKPEMEVERIYRDAAIRHISEYPERLPRRMFHKLWNTWRPTLSTASWRQQLVAGVSYPFLILASIVGFLMFARREAAWPLHLFLVLNIGLLALSIGAVRYRLPLWTALIPFAAAAIDRGWSAVGRARASTPSHR